MQQIADWLEKLGMSEYAQRFVDNAIDLSVLPDLTDQDLEKLGVLLGHRRKMLRAIAALGGAPVAEPTTAPASLTKAMGSVQIFRTFDQATASVCGTCG